MRERGKRSIVMRTLLLTDTNKGRRKIDIRLCASHRDLIKKMLRKLKKPLNPPVLLQAPIGVGTFLDEI
jgi:hypothetical protein